MKKLFAFSLIALAALAVSCNKNEQIASESTDSGLRTFTCSFADTKMSIDTSTDNEGKTAWEVGDQILIHGEYSIKEGYSQVVTLTSDNISDDGKTATFTLGDITVYNKSGYKSNLYAQYPADAVIENNHCYYNNRFNKSNAPLMVGYNDGNTFVMYHITGILSFVVEGDYDSYTIKGNSGETVAYSVLQSRIRLNSDDTVNDDGFPIRPSGDSFTSDPLTTFTDDVVADGQTENRFFIPGGVTFTNGFTIYFSNGDTIIDELVTTSNVEIAVGAYRPMGDVSDYLQPYTAPTSHPSGIPFDSGATDLGANGSANCYIVPTTGEAVYYFKAYKGNSTTGVGSIDSVDILWETWNNEETVTENSVIAAVDYDKQDSSDDYTMVFQMPENPHPGNALIAAKDVSGNILWSWHIWVPANAVEAASYGGIMASDLMDRNLGALVVAVAGADPVDVRSFGLLYQWGRKDPFPGVAATPSTPATVSKNATTKAEGTITLKEAIANPTLMGFTSNGDWIDVSDETLWQNAGKTIYDPCPPGYRVPVRNGDKDFWSSDMSTKTGWAESTNGWFTLGDPVAVFPFAGYIDDDGLSYKYAGSRALYWTAHRSGDVTSYGADVRYNDRHKLSSPARARAGSVRCTTE